MGTALATCTVLIAMNILYMVMIPANAFLQVVAIAIPAFGIAWLVVARRSFA
ncbi:MAG: hypothetical protein Q6370_002855 [Candidatus Sigynarchaeota archaeon]